MVEHVATKVDIDPGTLTQIIDVLKVNPLMSMFSNMELHDLLSQGVLLDLDAENVLSRQGEPVDHMFFIWEGRARAVFGAGRKADTFAVLNLLRPSDDIGLLSIVDGGPHSATVIALEPMRVVSVPIERFRDSCAQHPESYKIISQIAISRMRNMGTWLGILL